MTTFQYISRQQVSVVFKLCGLIVMVAALSPAPAHAYIDPGTGSFLVQGIIAAVIGGGMAIKLFWGKIKATLTGKPMDKDEDDDV